MKIKTGIEKKFLIVLLIIFAFVLPFSIVVGSIFLFQKTTQVIETFPEEMELSGEEGRVIPSEIIKKQASFSGKALLVRGEVVTDKVVCERKECPPEDQCCGCKDTRELVLIDPDASVFKEKQDLRLRLADQRGGAFCQRKQNSCDYDCADWEPGEVYDVWGKFIRESPPPGWQLSLNFYFLVEGKTRSKEIKTTKISTRKLNLLWSQFNEWLKRRKTSSYYILD